ncbi:OSCP-domain-containing protein [Lentinus brumalis]|uniref:ATP synthase subunit 5, mitochondrial n=2 Tax=Polyporaceae TaxID=5317 RepID=A0A371CYZ6_9APHY|nr:OSCP-domain-containing protein [Polyporus brumalis]
MSRGRAGKRPVIADGRYGTYRHGDEHALDDERPLFHDDDHSFHHLAAMFAASARSAILSAGLGRRAASTIAQKYSSAVFSAALKKSPQVLNKVQTELNAIHSAVKSTPELDTFIHNPTLSSNDRAAGLPAIYAAAGKEVSDITKNLFGVLSENGRLVEAQGVIEGFNELVAKYKGELDVTITSAAPLPRDIQTRLETLLKQSQAAQQAKSLKITNKVNPAVLGGVVVDFGDKTIDLSVASRVNKLNSLLTQSV